jgi:hypothetical protein
MHARTGSRVLGATLLVSALVLAPANSQAGVRNFMVVINGAQETPPIPSSATGNGILTWDTSTKTLCYYLSYEGALAGGEILAHIHGPAAPGVPAPVILGLPVGTTKTACVVAPPAPFSASDLLKNRYYVNIHSGGFPGGEIRGQILRIK